MAVQRVWLGWDRPVLAAAARWLMDQYATATQWDLSGLEVILPTARAHRRLMAWLVQQADGRMLVPPGMWTVGQLPALLDPDPPPVPSRLALQQTWARVLRQADADTLALLGSRPDQAPQATGAPAGAAPLGVLDAFALAQEMMALLETLAADCRTPVDAAQLADGAKARWDAIAQLTEVYEAQLTLRGWMDPHMARRDALSQGRCHAARTLVLLGCADLPRLTQQMLASADSPVIALIAANPDEADGFDDVGSLVPSMWAERAIDLAPDQLRIVDRPGDQARAIVQTIAQRTDDHTQASAITVGLGDEALAPAVQRALEQADAPVHLATGSSARHSRPGRLLEAVARYWRTPRFDALAALLRHPDVPGDVTGTAGWLTLMDRYLTDHVQGQVTGTWLGADGPRLKAVVEQIHAWLPDHPGQRQSLGAWAQPIARMLAKVYGQQTLARHDHDDATLLRSLTAIRDVLLSFEQLDEDDHDHDGPHPDDLAVTADQAILLLLSQLETQTLPQESVDDAIEVVGFLEMMLDDAPLAVVAGVHEGALPSSLTSDPLLPDHLRQRLGMVDNRHRLARDVYAMTMLLRTRPGTTLIAGRRTESGDPLIPSRLILRSDPHTIAQRLTDFYDPAPASTLATPWGNLAPGDPLQLLAPTATDQPLDRLRVTGFRDYLACPYRFYLKHVLKLKAIDDRADEISGMGFGNLAHRVLQAMGQSDCAAQSDPQLIQTFLRQQLDQEMQRMFGPRPTAAVVLQARQLRHRLDALAHWQAQSVRDGWRIMPDRLEAEHTLSLSVDGQPFTLTGTIDRMDEHPARGYRVIDYKTADAGKTPDKTHRHKGQWVDLQLPLYDALARGAGLPGPIELGYVLLPRDLQKVGFAPSGWDASMVCDGLDKARDVIRAIRAGQYWPPGDPPEFDDGLGELCYDRAMDRASLIGGND